MRTATHLTAVPLDAAYSLAQPDGSWRYWLASDDDCPVIEMAPIGDTSPVTRRQMLTALHRIGLLTTIKASVSASNDVELQIAFDESLEFEVGNPLISAMASKLGKSQADVDAIFALARTI